MRVARSPLALAPLIDLTPACSHAVRARKVCVWLGYRAEVVNGEVQVVGPSSSAKQDQSAEEGTTAAIEDFEVPSQLRQQFIEVALSPPPARVLVPLPPPPSSITHTHPTYTRTHVLIHIRCLLNQDQGCTAPLQKCKVLICRLADEGT